MDKVIDIEERIPSMREKRRRKTNKKFIFILTVFVVSLLAILYLQSSLSKVGKVSVHGANLHDKAFYAEQSGLMVGDSLWGFTSHEIEKTLSKIDGLQKVSVSRKWFREVDITITEWKTVAYINDKDRYNLLLENGSVFPDGTVVKADAPILNNFSDVAIRKKMTKQLMKMDRDVYNLISEIVYEGTEVDPDRLRVFMDDGFEVHAVMSTFADKMTYYPEVIAQLQHREKGVIDIEVGTFFTPFSEVYGLKVEGDPVDEEDE